MIVDPHIHMSARTTDDYEAMAAAGVVAVIEPAFWIGQPRTCVGSFRDYFASLIGWERFRASQFGIRHYAAIGLDAKEANDPGLADEVLALLPAFLGKDDVVAVGEIGFDEQTAEEERAVRAQLELAKQFTLPVIVHTPHRDKKRGTVRLMEIVEEHGLPPQRVVIDHNNEETVAAVLDRGFWVGFTIYPRTKMSRQRMVAVVERFGSDRIIVNSSADWGVSDPLAVPRVAETMRAAGIAAEHIAATCHDNAVAAFADMWNPAEWRRPVDQRNAFAGSSVLRGQDPRVDADD